eukprot:8387453-Pyramimonas_sp.AAC.1
MAQDNSCEIKKETRADFLLNTGARHPSDPAAKGALAITSHCHGRSLQPKEAYDELFNFKRK